MARKHKCTGCKEFFPKEQMIITNVGKFHSDDCRRSYGQSPEGISKALGHARKEKRKEVRTENAEKKRTEKAERARHRQRKKEVKGIAWWYDLLQDLINQWVVHVRDKNKPCCTCGTSKPNIKYDAGHYRSRGACNELRFELTNIHKQCSVNCNQVKSGARAEYREFIAYNYGKDHLEWLDGPHPLLKEQFPDWQSVEVEVINYRKLLREAGIKPCR